MTLPVFLMADNTDHPEDIFVIHTDFPRFIINLKNDDIHWLEEFTAEDEKDLLEEIPKLIEAATNFYDRECKRYEE